MLDSVPFRWTLFLPADARGRMGPGGLPSLQNCVSGGAPLTGGLTPMRPRQEKPKTKRRTGSMLGLFHRSQGDF